MNIEKVREVFPKVIKQINENPDSYNQLDWSCSSARCILGWVDRIFEIEGESIDSEDIFTTAEYEVIFSPVPMDGWPEPYVTAWKTPVDGESHIIRHVRVATAFMQEIMDTGKVRGA